MSSRKTKTLIVNENVI